MSPNSKAYVAASAMTTSIGANSKMTSASVRAGVVSIGEVDYYDGEYNPIRMATVPDQALESILNVEALKLPLSALQYRMLQIATLAIEDLSKLLPPDIPVPLFLAGPEDISNEGHTIDKVFIENIAIQSGINIDLTNSRCVATGRAGGLDVIDIAFKYFNQEGTELAVVGGVDTFYEKTVIDYYIKNERLLTTDSMEGFIPGEGAGFILLLSERAPAGLIEKCKIHIREPGTGYEEGYIGSDKHYLGSGLSQAISAALKNNCTSPVKLIMSSMNGESYFSKELGVAISRNESNIDDDFQIEHIIEYCGDIGAAIGPVMLGCLHENNDPKRKPALVYCSSDSGYRSALLVENNI